MERSQAGLGVSACAAACCAACAACCWRFFSFCDILGGASFGAVSLALWAARSAERREWLAVSDWKMSRRSGLEAGVVAAPQGSPVLMGVDADRSGLVTLVVLTGVCRAPNGLAGGDGARLSRIFLPLPFQELPKGGI